MCKKYEHKTNNYHPGSRTTAFRTFPQQLHARPGASSSSFAAAKTVKCFFFRYCQPPKGRASNRIWWLHTDRSSCCRCLRLCLCLCCRRCTFPTTTHESGHEFYCLLYYCISRVAYALNILPVPSPSWSDGFCSELCCSAACFQQISAPIFMFGVYYALLFRASF